VNDHEHAAAAAFAREILVQLKRRAQWNVCARLTSCQFFSWSDNG